MAELVLQKLPGPSSESRDVASKISNWQLWEATLASAPVQDRRKKETQACGNIVPRGREK